ncbi:MAG TPA: galactose oxidase-like domain-containing protein, partial [Gemmatimonadales bacterium]|nr:galactose oxidase-like domain-containing protein [Gemmatimonadales bacterium]
GFAFLKGGKLLVAGGHAGTDNFGLKTAYTFDQATRTWTRLPDMRNGRWYPTLTTLANGQVLAVSGGGTDARLNTLPEVYAPGANQRWRALTNAVRNVPYYPMMYLAPDGTVFYVGPDQQTAFLNTAGTGLWTTGPSRLYGWRDYGSSVMYDTGKILVVGGGSPTATAEIIDLNGTRTWSFAPSMSVPRRQMNATLLADGTVLATGGTNSSGFNTAPSTSDVLAPELWNPATPTTGWKRLASMSHHRLYHSTAILLHDGRVLSVGSGQPAAAGLTDDFTAEIFSPPYLFNADGTPAPRPNISSVPSLLTYGSTFTVRTTSAGSIAKVMLVRLSTSTHSGNQNQRGNSLSFTATAADQLSVSAPLNGKLAPPGHYMLFIINTSGVPSVAKTVRF